MPKKTKKKFSNKRKKFQYEFLTKLKRRPMLELMHTSLPPELVPMLNDSIVFDNGYRMSVQAGYHAYSVPKENLDKLSSYESFEVACFDMHGESIVVNPREWKDNFTGRYEHSIPHALLKNLNKLEEWHIQVPEVAVLPYLPTADVEALYQYLKRQKRKFVMTEKYKNVQYEEQD